MAGETDRQRFVRLLRARHACVVISTAEEAHAVATVVGAAVDVGRPVQTWSVVRGICEGLFVEEHQPEAGTETAAGALRAFAQEGRSRVLVRPAKTEAPAATPAPAKAEAPKGAKG